MVSSVAVRCVAVALAGCVFDLSIVAQTNPDVTHRSAAHRLEDQVAGLFESIRAKDGLQALARIGHRQSLDELVCSAAALDRPVWRENRPGAVMYRTNDPTSPTEDLERIARYADLPKHKDGPRTTRFAVAVWRSSDQQDSRAVYWVGVQVYMSAWWEFIDNNFTDDRPYRNDWKKLVTAACRGAE